MKYAVIGKSLPHTLSPEIHKEFGCLNYNVVELANENDAVEFVLSREFDGYNVTIPYKETVMPYLDQTDELALKVGAVNTVVQRGETLVGYNTDVDGMSYAMAAANIEVNSKRVLILGSGGTAKTAAFMAERGGAKEILTVSRSGKLNYENCYKTNAEVVINTTPVGMMPDSFAVAVKLEKFDNLNGVFDCVYNPLQTLLIKHAKLLNVPCANGLGMLVEQARLAHNIFVEAAKDAESNVKSQCGDYCEKNETARVLDALIKNRRNIVLIGMAGSGKTAIGRTLAAVLGREFIDTDALIEKSEGKSIPDIFRIYGERYFREKECDAIKNACSCLGAVIATGGGAVLDERNRFFIKANGTAVLVLRDEYSLDLKNRPLSDSREKAIALWNERKELYFSLQDVIIDNNKSIDEIVKELIVKL